MLRSARRPHREHISSRQKQTQCERSNVGTHKCIFAIRVRAKIAFFLENNCVCCACTSEKEKEKKKKKKKEGKKKTRLRSGARFSRDLHLTLLRSIVRARGPYYLGANDQNVGCRRRTSGGRVADGRRAAEKRRFVRKRIQLSKTTMGAPDDVIGPNLPEANRKSTPPNNLYLLWPKFNSPVPRGCVGTSQDTVHGVHGIPNRSARTSVTPVVVSQRSFRALLFIFTIHPVRRFRRAHATH